MNREQGYESLEAMYSAVYKEWESLADEYNQLITLPGEEAHATQVLERKNAVLQELRAIEEQLEYKKAA